MGSVPTVTEVHVELAERPGDSPLRCSFVPLIENDLVRRLATLANPERIVFDAARGHLVDIISFQPCLRSTSQDRFVAQQLDVHGQKWTFTGVFDGHLGDATVEHTAYHLPIIVKQSLQKVITGPASPAPGPELIRNILSNAITSFDDAIAGDVLKLFPGGLTSLENRTDEEIQAVVNDFDGPNGGGGGANYQKAKLCLYGTTALFALVDPAHENLWVANLGDCEAVLVTPGTDGRLARHEVLNVLHNGSNPAEIARVRRDHPGEPESVLNGRVLGTIAPFRCIGDAAFKQPAIFTRRVLYNLYPGVADPTPWEVFLARNRTPPYISSEPDVIHRRLGHPRSLLILATDGLGELYDGAGRGERVADWARYVAEGAGAANLALRLLRHALGGEDLMSISQMITLDMETPWMDDTTIIVQAL
ncbi:phosphatase 2C-like domain-containing protein [Multifurca ochricompacta]|uniref:Phosphatase 2C-like domain-containing protein n=1 Tax=Multifurca ochricompacta TaxID=376703 RepID=A0AAD4M744_9AGAM|nr:phosphatase 2C-like domain-containing protein [Multifurca ochricompacta]